MGDVNRSRRASMSLATEQKKKKKQPCQPLCNGGEDDRTHTHARIAASHRTFFAEWKCLYSNVYYIILLYPACRRKEKDVKSFQKFTRVAFAATATVSLPRLIGHCFWTFSRSYRVLSIAITRRRHRKRKKKITRRIFFFFFFKPCMTITHQNRA